MAETNNKKVLVIGDSMADRYIYGKVEKVSKEAPIPVVEYEREELHLGGAANVAVNMLNLGHEVSLCTLLGQDDGGARVKKMLEQMGVGLEHLFEEEERLTTTVTRFIAGNQVQIFRLDRETKESLSLDREQEILDYLEDHIGSYGMLVLTDYGGTMFSNKMSSTLVRFAKNNEVRVIASVKHDQPQRYAGVYLLKPELEILASWANMKIENERDTEIAMQKMKGHLRVDNVLVDRGEDGLMLLDEAYQVHHYESECDNPVDITGSGATIMAVMGSFLIDGFDPKKSGKMACLAASIKKGKLGTTVLDLEELEEFEEEIETKEDKKV